MGEKHFSHKYSARKKECGGKHFLVPQNKVQCTVCMTEKELSSNTVFTCKHTLLSSVTLRMERIDNFHDLLAKV